MGNCLVMEKKVIKIMRNDGKVLEYKEPITVHHILSQFSNHSLFDNIHNLLHDDAKLLSGRFYYLLPNKTETKSVNHEVEEEDEKKNVSVVRMKIVVHKQELKKLLQGGSLHELNVEKQVLLSGYVDDDDDDDGDVECNGGGWRPVLDCIPESE